MINDDALRDKPTLIGERLRLVPLQARHADGLWQAVRDPETRRLTGTLREFTYDDIRDWCAGRGDQADRLDLAIEDAATGEFLGDLALNELDRNNESADVRIALLPGRPGKGLGVEALRLLLHYAFEEIRLHRVQLDVFAFNDRAVRAYEKAGFRHEGRSRQAHHWEGERHDVLWMAALNGEWR
ncbi:GNAT family N-acetyltransferase [Kitasatospora camelliae]|uniref:GNAT family protein n=1 Tax=Kitasatospora camelliae TaxID=3156397 RepID=A0AAU8JVF1_9ACTN